MYENEEGDQEDDREEGGDEMHYGDDYGDEGPVPGALWTSGEEGGLERSQGAHCKEEEEEAHGAPEGEDSGSTLVPSFSGNG